MNKQSMECVRVCTVAVLTAMKCYQGRPANDVTYPDVYSLSLANSKLVNLREYSRNYCPTPSDIKGEEVYRDDSILNILRQQAWTSLRLYQAHLTLIETCDREARTGIHTTIPHRDFLPSRTEYHKRTGQDKYHGQMCYVPCLSISLPGLVKNTCTHMNTRGKDQCISSHELKPRQPAGTTAPNTKHQIHLPLPPIAHLYIISKWLAFLHNLGINSTISLPR